MSKTLYDGKMYGLVTNKKSHLTRSLIIICILFLGLKILLDNKHYIKPKHKMETPYKIPVLYQFQYISQRKIVFF